MQEHAGDTAATINDGYRAPQVCNLVGISYRQLDYWARTGLITPSIQTAHGSGTQRRYSFTDIVQLKVVKRLLDAGMSLKRIRSAMEILRVQLESDAPLADVTLLSDGTTIYAAHSPDEVVDVFRPRPGRFWDRSRPGSGGTRRRDPSLVSRAGSCRGVRSGGNSHLSIADEFDDAPADNVEFAHESEHQFAKLLDFYDMPWSTEPRAFEVEWDESGEATRYFRPDFSFPKRICTSRSRR